VKTIRGLLILNAVLMLGILISVATLALRPSPVILQAVSPPGGPSGAFVLKGDEISVWSFVPDSKGEPHLQQIGRSSLNTK
jgi:hypothetical protein